MRVFQVFALTVAVLLSVAYARPRPQQQQQIDPAFLREYYSQIAQRGAPTEATPIYEQDSQQGPQQQQQQYLGQQIRVRDPVSEQVKMTYRYFY